MEGPRNRERRRGHVTTRVHLLLLQVWGPLRRLLVRRLGALLLLPPLPLRARHRLL